MGSWLSGRRDGGPLTEDAWKLDLAHCFRLGLFRPGQHVTGSMKWTRTSTGEVTATVGYEASLIDPAAAWLRLNYTSTYATEAKVDRDYRIPLETTHAHYGGHRWWFRCPSTGRRTRVLYLPSGGGTIFASRQAYGLTYPSQRQSPEDRAVGRSLKARQRLGINDQNMLDMPYCPKPKWMRRKTHRRLVAVIQQCHDMQWAYAARRWPGARV